MLWKSFLIINATTVYSSFTGPDGTDYQSRLISRINQMTCRSVTPCLFRWVLTLIQRSIPLLPGGSNTVDWILEVAPTGSTCIARRSIYFLCTSVARINSYSPIKVKCNATITHADQVHINSGSLYYPSCNT